MRGGWLGSSVWDKVLKKNVFFFTPFLNGLAAHIQFSESLNQWMISDVGSNVTAVSQASRTSSVLGKYNWTFKGESKCAAKDYLLKLTGCFEVEFTCSDGECIGMDRRCDHVFNCRDRFHKKNDQLS